MLAVSIYLHEAVKSGPSTSTDFHLSQAPLAAQLRPEKTLKSIEVGDVWVKLVSLKGEVRYTHVSNVKEWAPLEEQPRQAPQRRAQMTGGEAA